jgi:tetratricopeptide (TPR) repeat protein
VLIWLYTFLLESDATVPPGIAPGTAILRAAGATMRMAPFALETLLYLAARRVVLGFVNRSNPLNPATFWQALMTIPHALDTYLMLLVVPWQAGPSHRLLIVTSPLSPEFYLPLIAVAVLAAAFLVAIWNHPRRPLYLFCVGWTLLAIAPMMNFRGLFQQGLIQDRYLYLSSVGWCVMLADWIVAAARRNAPGRRIAWGVAAAIVALYAFALFNVQRFWHDEVALFSRCVEMFPESALWHNRLGMALSERDDLTGAERELGASLSLDPRDGGTLYDLGAVHAELGMTRQGADEIAAGLRLLDHPPAGAYVTLARLYDQTGDAAETEAALKTAASLPDGGLQVAIARAQIGMSHGDAGGAENILRHLAAHYPRNAGVWSNLGAALGAQNRQADALAAFHRAIALAPRDESNHLLAALALHAMKREREALEECNLAIAAAPGDPRARELAATIRRSLPP